MSKDLKATSSAIAHSPLFTKLSGELRNRVWSLTISGDRVINMSPTTHVEPGLLTACRLIREEAGSLYYYDNKFRVVCARYNSTALLIASRKFTAFKVPLGGKHGYTIDFDGTPSWSNLIIWLERIHAGSLACPALNVVDAGIDTRVLHGTFQTAAGLRDIPWSRVEALLKWQRAVLVKINSAWGEEPRDQE
nr:hypothetical protein B0A51_07204 [Rachicladosporium sp. CCFEE 5018]